VGMFLPEYPREKRIFMAYQGKTTKITFFEFNRFYFVLKRRII
jgi:hypothetical protein